MSNPACPRCSNALQLVAGGAVSSLWKCRTCGSQMMLPGDAPVAAAASVQAVAPGPVLAAAAAAASVPLAVPDPDKAVQRRTGMAIAVSFGFVLLALLAWAIAR